MKRKPLLKRKPSLLTTLQIKKSTSMFKSARQNTKEWFLNFSTKKFLKQQKTFVAFAQEKRETTCFSKETSSTVSSKASWLKEEIQLIRTALAENQSMDTSLTMKTSGSLTTRWVFSPWPTLAKTPMVPSSSLPSSQPLIWMESTLCLDDSSRDSQH